MDDPQPIIWGSLDLSPSKENPVTPQRPAIGRTTTHTDQIPGEIDLAQFSAPQSIALPPHPLSSTLSNNLLPSAPASPPTPAPSPTPHSITQSWSESEKLHEDGFSSEVRTHFAHLDTGARQKMLSELLDICDSKQLSFVLSYVSPRLRKDPFVCLPEELCLRILSFVDEPRTLARASQVSRRWYSLLGDDLTWKHLCERHSYRRPSQSYPGQHRDSHFPFGGFALPKVPFYNPSSSHRMPVGSFSPLSFPPSNPRPEPFQPIHSFHPRTSTPPPENSKPSQQKAISYKNQYKNRFLVERAWRSGSTVLKRHITTDQGVVTSLHLTSKYIIVALDNAKIHVFDNVGNHLRTLQGHVMGVWAIVPSGDTLISGGCDRDVRVWNMETGECQWLCRGHTSTVRCLKMSDSETAISGSRDMTLRVWDIKRGVCKTTLSGHQASVRCVEVQGDIVVSGSYDTTARVWNINTGKCLHVLSGHFSQIYAIAFDGVRIATGSLDTSVRIWDPRTGLCRAILQGHTSLVGQLQMQGNTLVTGGSDGSIRVWSLLKMSPIHRLAAHDNSVTSLQFDQNRIVSGGSDGRVKVWDIKTGQLVRELSQPADAVWRVAFEDEKAVIMTSRNQRTIMEVWSFAPDASRAGLPERETTPISTIEDAETPREEDGDEDEVAIRSPRPKNPRSEGRRRGFRTAMEETAQEKTDESAGEIEDEDEEEDEEEVDGEPDEKLDVVMGEMDDEDDDDQIRRHLPRRHEL